MFLITKPSDDELREFLSALPSMKYSYANVGATASVIPRSYNIDHNRIRLGAGEDAWTRAVSAIESWEMFNLGWTQLCWRETPIRVDSNVVILVSHFGFYSLNGARIVYVVNENGPLLRRFGFAYGTLEQHAESGEERCTVEWNQQDDFVWYDLLAFSRPAHLMARLAFPLARGLQRRFAADSLTRVQSVVSNTPQI